MRIKKLSNLLNSFLLFQIKKGKRLEKQDVYDYTVHTDDMWGVDDIKVQEIDTSKGRRWILLNDEYQPITEVNAYLKFLDNVGRTENTLRTYAYALKLYCDYLSLRKLKICDLDRCSDNRPLDVLSDYLVWLQQPDIVNSQNIILIRENNARSAKTINTLLGIVLSLYDYLGRNQLADPFSVYREKIDMRKFKPFLYEMVKKHRTIKSSLLHIPEQKKQLEYIDENMYARMIHECTYMRDRAIIAFMFDAGLRLGETLGLRTEDIEVWNNKINIVSRPNNINHCQVKNKAEGAVYVSNRAIEYLATYYTDERPDNSCDFVFVNLTGPNTGKPMKPDTIEKLFDRLSIRLGVSLHPHMCRHGCATMRLEAGWDEPSIQKQLRHVNVSTTKMYEHFQNELLLKKTKELMIQRQEKFGWDKDEK